MDVPNLRYRCRKIMGYNVVQYNKLWNLLKCPNVNNWGRHAKDDGFCQNSCNLFYFFYTFRFETLYILPNLLFKQNWCFVNMAFWVITYNADVESTKLIDQFPKHVNKLVFFTLWIYWQTHKLFNPKNGRNIPKKINL